LISGTNAATCQQKLPADFPLISCFYSIYICDLLFFFRLPGTSFGLVPMTSRSTASLFGFQDHLSATTFGQLENLTTTMFQSYETLFSWPLLMGQNKLWCLSITLSLSLTHSLILFLSHTHSLSLSLSLSNSCCYCGHD